MQVAPGPTSAWVGSEDGRVRNHPSLPGAKGFPGKGGAFVFKTGTVLGNQEESVTLRVG